LSYRVGWPIYTKTRQIAAIAVDTWIPDSVSFAARWSVLLGKHCQQRFAGKDAAMVYKQCWVLVAACCMSMMTSLVAQEFRIETEVFVGDSTEPVSESLTIFAGEVVYDFLLGDSEEITIFDINRGRIMLLDPRQQVKAELSTVDLLQFCEAIKNRTAKEFDAALFAPLFQQSFDEERSLLTLTSDRMTYAVKGMAPKQPEATQRYQQFADWYARLNALKPGNLPPFGRIEVNKSLAERNLIPVELERTLMVERPIADKKLIARSHHATTWLISNTDRKRIETAGNYVSKFRKVSPKEYWQTDRVAVKK
jgi:hypothetical protein